MMNTKTSLAVVALLFVAQIALANPGISINASPMRFVYTRGAGGAGSVGRIDIASTANANLTLQQINFGSDNALGGGNDSSVDLGTLGEGQFKASFTGDVFKIGDLYAVIGSYTIVDSSKKVVIEGDFTSQSVQLVDGSLSLTGGLFNQNGIFRSGSSLYNYTPAVTTGDGNGGLPAILAALSDAPSLGNLLELNLSGKLLTLDKLFGSSLQVNTAASIKLAPLSSPPIVPAPQAAALAVMGLVFVFRRPRLG